MKKKPNLDPRKRSRVSKMELAQRAGVSRAFVTRHLAADGAPHADKAGRYDPIRAAFFLGQMHARGAEPPTMLRLRQRRAEVELERLEVEAKMEHGELVRKSLIEPTIAAVMANLTRDL